MIYMMHKPQNDFAMFEMEIQLEVQPWIIGVYLL